MFMGDIFRVLFVCTGNIYRSAGADLFLKKFLFDKGISGVSVSSAGVIADPEEMFPVTINVLESFGVDPSSHKQRKLSKNMLSDSDLVVCMSKNHQEYIKKFFGFDTVLFNELAFGKNTSILDLGESKNQHGFRNAPYALRDANRAIPKTLKHINKGIGKLWDFVEEHYLLFSRFLEGKSSHRNGIPPKILYESKNVAVFMSVDIPATQDGHVLVIPKKRFGRLEDIPSSVRRELIETVELVGKALLVDHEGYNVLLNNGKSAGQWVYHTHFHVIPRNSFDDITIERWKRRKSINRKDFDRMNKKVLSAIKMVSKKK
jgi:diadenosine tetraphosphate (Ap4A) HIT family hydrolase/protein-tyrosine-phosphatase